MMTVKVMLSESQKRSAKQARFKNPSAQSGAVLLVGLIILLILTIVGTSGMTSVTMEEKMISNLHNSNKAFQGAEAVLTECENVVARLPLQDLEVGENGVQAYEENENSWGSANWWEDPLFWAANGITSLETGLVASADSPGELVQEPKCVIEYVGSASSGGLQSSALYAGAGQQIGTRYVYRVVGASYGADLNTNSVLESLFVKK